MAELLTPGVFFEEVQLGPQPIEGVSTTTAGFCGETERGTVSGPPVLVTSFNDFQRRFGGFVAGKHLAYAVRGFFENGGRRAYVARAVGPNNDEAELATAAQDGLLVRLLAVNPVSLQVTLSSVVSLNIGDALTLIRKSDNDEVPANVVGVNGATGVVSLAGADLTDVRPNTHIARISGTAATVTFRARDPGSFGNAISVLVEPHYVGSTPVLASLPGNRWQVGSLAGVELGTAVQLEQPDARETATVVAIDAANHTLTLSQVNEDYAGGRLFVIGWRVTVSFRGEVVETFQGLSSVLANGVAQRFAQDINARSNWIVVTGSPDLDPADAHFPSFPLAAPMLMEGGDDGDPADAASVIGVDTTPRSGLKTLEATDGINIIAAPGFTQEEVIDELIAQAERRMDRFAVFESGPDLGAVEPTTDINVVLTQRGRYNSRYAAMYHPWLRVLDPITRTNIVVPPSGHILGAYARTDIERGVFKAPANVVLRGITGFAVDVPTGEQDVLNPLGVNVLRRFTGLGDVIWGARTISAEGLWKYVPVRRLFIFLEQSIIRGTRYAVFEPNDMRLWSQLRDSVSNFLFAQWRTGALFGARPEEAFFVRVDETTTTQDDRDNGRVNILVGIAPVKPAEFIVFQIGQAAQSVIVGEHG